MKKSLASRILGALIALLLLPALSAPAAAAQQADLITLDRVTDLVVIVGYDTEEPEITFLAPDGTRYAESLDNVRVDRGEGILYFHISQAQAGAWRLSYDKKGNQELTINFARDVQAVTVTPPTLERNGDNYLRVTFQADYPEDTVCSYILYAVLTDGGTEVSGQRELGRGQGQTNQPIQANVSLNGLSTYDSYRVLAEVYLESNGVEVFDTAVSAEAFSYQNGSAPAPMENAAITVDLYGGSMSVSWERWRPYGCDGYLLAVFRAGESDPFFFQEFDSGISSCDVLIDGAAGALRVELTYRRGGISSQTLSRTVDLAMAEWVTIATPENTNAAQARVEYRLPRPLTVQVETGGRTEQLDLEGEGFFAASLQDGVNQLSVSYSPEEQLTFVTRKEIVCDRVAPVLRLFETGGTIRTGGASYILTGQAELGCQLTVAGEAVALESDGTFMHTLPLSLGENTFEIVLTDPAGNRTVQTLAVERIWSMADSSAAPGTAETSPILSWLPLILSAAGGLLVMLLGLLLFRKGKDGKRHAAATLSVLLGLANLLLAVTAGFFAYQYFVLSKDVNSSSFLALAQNSFSQAYELLTRYNRYGLIALSAGIGALILLAVNILLASVRGLAKRRAAQKGQEDAPKKKERKQKEPRPKKKKDGGPPARNGGGEAPEA